LVVARVPCLLLVRVVRSRLRSKYLLASLGCMKNVLLM
jgi:hypothetical protein